MSNTNVAETFKEKAEALLQLTDPNGSANWEDIDMEDIQKLIERLLQIYGSRVRNLDQRHIHEEGMPRPVPEQGSLTQTDAVIFIDQLLQLKEIELFEVQMWRSL